MSSPIANALKFLEGDLEVNLIPVLLGAIAIVQKSPTVLGRAAAKAYLLGNAPAALLAAEGTAVTSGLSTLAADLQKMLASAGASQVPIAPPA